MTTLAPEVAVLLATATALLGVAGVIADHHLELLAEHAAFGVELLDDVLAAPLHLVAEDGVGAGHRTVDGDQGVGRGGAAESGRERKGEKRTGQRHGPPPSRMLRGNQ